MSLCANLGVDQVRQRIKPVTPLDTMVRLCFSDTNASPVECLASYFADLSSRVLPLDLWKHDGGDQA